MRYVWIVAVACWVLLIAVPQKAKAITFEMHDGNVRISDIYGDLEKWSEVGKLMQVSGAMGTFSGLTHLQKRRILLEIKMSNKNIDDATLSLVMNSIGSIIADDIGHVMSYLANYYYNNFSKNEIRVMQEFYETPTGKKLVGLQARFTYDYVDFIDGWVEQLTPLIKEKINKEILDERGYHWD